MTARPTASRETSPTLSRRSRVRRKALERVVRGQSLVLPARRLSPNGFAAWTGVLHRGRGGYVGKDPESTYLGGRTLKWLKVKQARYREGERGWKPKS
jgi:ATP-dependent DNA ligase